MVHWMDGFAFFSMGSKKRGPFLLALNGVPELTYLPLFVFSFSENMSCIIVKCEDFMA